MYIPSFFYVGIARYISIPSVEDVSLESFLPFIFGGREEVGGTKKMKVTFSCITREWQGKRKRRAQPKS